MSPDETAKKILEEQMAPSLMKFTEFRFAMIDRHPSPLSDDEIHDLYMAHVIYHGKEPIIGRPSRETERRLMYGRPKLSNEEAQALDRPAQVIEPLAQAIDQVVKWHDKNRPSMREFKKVAKGKGPRLIDQAMGTPSVPKKPLGDYTIAEVVGRVRNFFRNSHIRRDA